MLNKSNNQNLQNNSMQVVTLIHETDKMSSLEIAEITGRTHSNVMRDIRSLLAQGVNQINFEAVEYIDKKGEKRPCFNLSKKGCLILASGYDAKLREKIIDRWEKLEIKERNGGFQVPISFKEALLLAAQQQEQIEEQQKQIELKEATIQAQSTELQRQAPKVDYYNNTLQSVNTLTTTQIAKSIGIDANKLNKKLKEIGILYRQSGQWLLHSPYSTWKLHATRTQVYTRSDGSTGTSTYTVWTEKGRRFIIALNENDFDVKKAIKVIKGEKVS